MGAYANPKRTKRSKEVKTSVTVQVKRETTKWKAKEQEALHDTWPEWAWPPEEKYICSKTRLILH